MEIEGRGMKNRQWSKMKSSGHTWEVLLNICEEITKGETWDGTEGNAHQSCLQHNSTQDQDGHCTRDFQHHIPRICNMPLPISNEENRRNEVRYDPAHQLELPLPALLHIWIRWLFNKQPHTKKRKNKAHYTTNYSSYLCSLNAYTSLGALHSHGLPSHPMSNHLSATSWPLIPVTNLLDKIYSPHNSPTESSTSFS